MIEPNDALWLTLNLKGMDRLIAEQCLSNARVGRAQSIAAIMDGGWSRSIALVRYRMTGANLRVSRVGRGGRQQIRHDGRKDLRPHREHHNR
jgi:hypothetical protein